MTDFITSSLNSVFQPQLIGETIKRGSIMLVGLVVIVLGTTVLIAGTNAGRAATSGAVKLGKTVGKVAAVAA